MIGFIYRVEKLSRGRWIPVFYPPQSSLPLESADLNYIYDRYKFLASNYDNLRLVKVETHLINSNF